VSSAGWILGIDSLHADIMVREISCVGSKHIFVFCYFVISINGLKSFKSIVVLFAPCRLRNGLINKSTSSLIIFLCKVEHQVFLSATFILCCFFILSLFFLTLTNFCVAYTRCIATLCHELIYFFIFLSTRVSHLVLCHTAH